MAFDANKVLGIGSVVAPIVSGIAGGIANSGNRRQNEQDLEYRKQQDELARLVQAYERLVNAQKDAYNLESGARGSQIANLQGLGNRDLERSIAIMNASPLGAEQALAGKNAVRLALGQAMANRPAPTAYGGVVNPFKNMDLSSFTPDATRAAIEERRKLLAGVQPDFQFGSLAPYGMEDTSNVADYQAIAAGKRSANEDAVTQLVNEQLALAQSAGQNQVAAAQQFNLDENERLRAQEAIAQQQAQKSGGGGGFLGFLKGLGKTALKVAPFAVSAIPGIGPLAGGLLRAGLGAAGGALDGGGLTGAITGGALSAISGPSQAPAGSSFGSNIQKAILSPQGLGTLAGSMIPGQTGQAVRGISSQLPGPQYTVPQNPASTTSAPWQPMPQMNRQQLPMENLSRLTDALSGPAKTVVNPGLTTPPAGGRMRNVLAPPAQPRYAPGTMIPLSASPNKPQPPQIPGNIQELAAGMNAQQLRELLGKILQGKL